MSRKIEDLTPALQPLATALLERCAEAGIPLLITQGLRTREEQAALYAQGRTTPGKIVTNAPPGTSRHEAGEAFDVAFREPDGGVTWEGPWSLVGEIAESIGLEWGGRFKSFPDRPHMQLKREIAPPSRPTLRRGSTGPAVLDLTRALVRLRLMSFPSSRFGPKTEWAVKMFQTQHGLTIDGLAGPLTMAALTPAAEREGRS